MIIEMKRYQIHTQTHSILGDTMTPVSLYLALRDVFPNSLLLESSDYHGNEHTYSYICLYPIAGFRVEGNRFIGNFPDQEYQQEVGNHNTVDTIEQFLQEFEVKSDVQHPFIYKGMFGFMTWDAIPLMEDIRFRHQELSIPQLQYSLYRYILAYNHNSHRLFIITNTVNDELIDQPQLDSIIRRIHQSKKALFEFSRVGEKQSNLQDDEFKEMVRKGIYHCHQGDVFQIVLSRKFSQRFKGDDFNVYRALRSINPSPYLFYFDMGSYHIFGSSPEAQLVIKGDKVSIFPIAGTFRRTGDDEKDAALARQLSNDPKENAEHIMLVDLARNDLSRCGSDVQVEVIREIQFYSHVIHLVSKVSARLDDKASRFRMVGDTFPAGTLSGAPKYKAMELIDKIENTGRGFYGGAIGHLDFNGDYNHAIMIRTFLSKDNSLHFQAGAGVVADSVPENELKEVDNKLMALNRAIEMAETL